METEFRQQLAQRETSLTEIRQELNQSNAARAAAEASHAAAEKLIAEQRQIHQHSLAEAKSAQDKAIADLREAFKALSADALKQTQPEFLRLANETLGKFQETAGETRPAPGSDCHAGETAETAQDLPATTATERDRAFHDARRSEEASQNARPAKPVPLQRNVATPSRAQLEIKRADAGARRRSDAWSRRQA